MTRISRISLFQSRSFILQFLFAVWIGLCTFRTQVFADGPWQVTGMKIGEISENSAIVWTRLTLRKTRNPADGPMVKFVYAEDKAELPVPAKKKKRIVRVEYPEGSTVADIRNAVPGTTGRTRVQYRIKGSQEWKTNIWKSVDTEADFTAQHQLENLKANTHYEVIVESENSKGEAGAKINGQFVTAPSREESEKVVFTVSTGQAYKDQDSEKGYQIYGSMRKLNPSFFVHTGDIVYYDTLAKTRELANYHWQRTYSLPSNVEFHNNVGSYFIKDDHDTWRNDCWPGMKREDMFQFTFEQGLKIFPEQVPMGKKTYRTYRWGKDLQIWMVEGRDFRSPNTLPDGPEKTIWGKEQMEWFKKTVAASDATFRVLISPTPIVGPDRNSKADNHSNKNFQHEGNELRKFIASQKNLVVVCGDRHWQYHSIHPDTGVREYSCGPASDQHAGGWKQSDFRKDYHQYLNVIGGFLSATVERNEKEASLTFRYHDVNGKVRYEDRLTGG